MDKVTPQERADAVDASIIRSWDDVPEPFRTEVQETVFWINLHQHGSD